MTENQIFRSKSFEKPEDKNFEDCTFIQCDFSRISLDFFKFEHCSFEECNLSNLRFNQTSFQECEFTECKLTGVSFESINPFLFGIKCRNCDLSYAYFAQNDLRRSYFIQCNFLGAQFVEVRAQNVDFSGCNFEGTVFDHSNLEEANLVNTSNLSMNIGSNKVTGMKINQYNLAGLLGSYQLDIIE